MDEKLLEEIISDFEKISNIVNFRLNQLRDLLNKDNKTFYNIERQKKEMINMMENARKSAMEQIQNISKQTGDFTVPSIPSHNFGATNNKFGSNMDINKIKQDIINKIKKSGE